MKFISGAQSIEKITFNRNNVPASVDCAFIGTSFYWRKTVMKTVHIEVLILLFGWRQKSQNRATKTIRVNQPFTVSQTEVWGGHNIFEEVPMYTWHIVQCCGCCIKCAGEYNVMSNDRTKVHQLLSSVTVWYSNFMLDQNIVKYFPDTLFWRMDTGGKRSYHTLFVEAKLWFRLCQRKHMGASTLSSSLCVAFPNQKHLFTHMLLTTKNTLAHATFRVMAFSPDLLLAGGCGCCNLHRRFLDLSYAKSDSLYEAYT